MIFKYELSFIDNDSGEIFEHTDYVESETLSAVVAHIEKTIVPTYRGCDANGIEFAVSVATLLTLGADGSKSASSSMTVWATDNLWHQNEAAVNNFG